MFITDALLGEHAIFYLLLEHIERSLPDLDSLSNLNGSIAAFAFSLESHAVLEDELLFIALEPHLGTHGGPLAIMRMEHDQITDLFAQIESASSMQEGRVLATKMIQVTRSHFQKEEQILFRMARQFLGDDELSSLGASWLENRVPGFDGA